MLAQQRSRKLVHNMHSLCIIYTYKNNVGVDFTR